MPKMPNQKQKLLILRRYLYENTDENHKVSVSDMANYLEACGVSAERKSLYDDIEQLRAFGDDILLDKSERKTGYYVTSREFELSELKLLVDAVQGSKFITRKKSAQLIKKLEGLCSRSQGAELSRQVLISRRIKNMNESIYYSVDALHAAINSDSSIKFQYFDYDLKFERVLRHDGKFYTVSPFALTWDDENYYLIAYDHESRMIRHYRVDRMVSIKPTGERRLGREEFEKTDIESYSGKVFSMFGGTEQRIGMEFDNSLTNAVIDRFGKDIMMRKSENNGKFYISADVIVSPHFYGWLFSFGEKVKLVSPESAVAQFKEYADSVRALYESK